MSERVLDFTYTGERGQRLDKYLVERLPEFSRSRLQEMIARGFVLIDGHPAGKSGLKLEPGQAIQINIPPVVPADVRPEKIPLDVIYEDEALLVVNKPAGMVVHPAGGHASGTLVNAALAHAPELEGIGGEQRPGIVHRLDKATSGIIVIAKNERIHRWLQDQFRLRQVEKVYLALVDGKPPTPSGRIEAPIGRDPAHRKKMAIVPAEKGRQAVSEYHTRESFSRHTLLEVHPLTGRTHQIRLHLSFLGCPVTGDKTYGHRKSSLELERHFLHAWRLNILLPGTLVPASFEAPLPQELVRILDELRRSPR